jgi:hypothetical protein
MTFHNLPPSKIRSLGCRRPAKQKRGAAILELFAGRRHNRCR